MKRYSAIIIVLVLTICTLLTTDTASAQSRNATPTPTITVPNETPPSGVNMTLSPTFLNLTTDPGKQISSQFKVTNNNSFREYVELKVQKFESGPEGPVIQEVTADDEFTKWVDFSETQFVLEPNQTKTVKFTVTPPSTASLGYYYAFSVNRMRPGGKDGTGAAVTGAPALPFLLLVNSPNAKRELQIIDFKTDKVLYEYLPTEFQVKVKNSGNVHLAPSGDIFIDSLVNKDVALLPANKGRGNILPQTERVFSTTWDDGFAVRVPKMKDGEVVKNDKGEVQYEMKYDFTKANKFRMGKYTAHLIMVYDNGERDVPIEARVSFWVFPWKIMGIGSLIVLFALYGIVSVVITNIKKLRRK